MYRFYIDETELPVAPGALNLKIRGANKTLTLINDGEINLLKIPGLTEINFDFLLPMSEGYSFCGEYRRPEYYDRACPVSIHRQPYITVRETAVRYEYARKS